MNDKIRNLIDWLNAECPSGTKYTDELSHDFAENLRKRLDDIEKDKNKCPACNGSGYLGDYKENRCANCYGSGKIN